VDLVDSPGRNSASWISKGRNGLNVAGDSNRWSSGQTTGHGVEMGTDHHHVLPVSCYQKLPKAAWTVLRQQRCPSAQWCAGLGLNKTVRKWGPQVGLELWILIRRHKIYWFECQDHIRTIRIYRGDDHQHKLTMTYNGGCGGSPSTKKGGWRWGFSS